MDVKIIKENHYSIHGKVNLDPDRVRIVLDLHSLDFKRLKRIFIDNEVDIIYGDLDDK